MVIKLNTTIETVLGIQKPFTVPEIEPDPLTAHPRGLFFGAAVIQRVLVTVLSILFSILVPEFSSVMAFLGSFSAFVLCVIGPIVAKIMLSGRCGVFDLLILVLGIIKVFWGTTAAFLAA
jgi:vesicular inhibitory amino acid transporter